MSSSSGAKPKVNLRSTAVKRIMQEASELANPQEDDFVAAPLESDIFEWHCTMKGVQGSEYEGGLYHLRILLPPSYPMSAPDIILLTPNGRFELGKKICIDGLTSFHAGSWQPAWGVRTAITGLRSFWMQGGEALSAIGALDCSADERKRLAKLSTSWTCPTCGVPNSELLGQVEPITAHSKTISDVDDSLSSKGNGDSSGQSLTPRVSESHSESSDPIRSPSENTTPRPPDPPPTRTSQSPAHDEISPRPVPRWLDVTLIIFISLLVVLVAHRLS